MLLYTAVTLFGTAASRSANPILVTLVEASLSVIPPLMAILVVGKNSWQSSKFGLWMAVISGVAIGLFTLTLIKSFSQNKVGIVAPLVFGGSIFLSTVLSYFIFKEKITSLQLVGLIFLGIGFGIIIYTRAYSK